MSTEELIAALQAFYGDTSRSRAATREGLEEAQDQIEQMLETLQDDD